MRTSRFVVPLFLAWVVFSAALPLPACAGGRALLIGVEQYKDQRYNLDGDRNDVKLMERILLEKGVFDKTEIKVLLDGQATKQNVVKNFKEWLIAGTKPGDTALFYFSGHGILVWDEGGVHIQTGMDPALMCHDSNVSQGKVKDIFDGRPGLAFRWQDCVNVLLGVEIGELIAELKGRMLIFLSDSCHSGTVYKSIDSGTAVTKNWDLPGPFSRTKGVRDDRAATWLEKAVVRKEAAMKTNLLHEGVNLVALTASEDSQPAQMIAFDKDPKGKHSVFTWHMYQGLKGAADTKGDGKITFAQLADFVEDSLKREGYNQVPQHYFSPEEMGRKEIGGPGVPPQPAPMVLQRPKQIDCYLDGRRGLMASEVQRIKTMVSSNISVLRWTSDKDKAAIRVALEKGPNDYVGQITDSTGAVWESHHGPSLDALLPGVVGNMRAYYVQTSVAALKNRPNRMAFDLTYRTSNPRAVGQAVKGDSVEFEARPKSSGHLLVFSIDALGIIHPLYPLSDQPAAQASPGKPVVMGENGAFTVTGPFGRDLVCGIMSSDKLTALEPFWKQDDVGSRDKLDATDQARFLDALWGVLAPPGARTGEWATEVLFLTSFASAGGS